MPAPPRPSLDDLLRKKEPARLIPRYHLKQKEQRLTTVLLATMTVVRPLAESLLKAWSGRTLGKRARLSAYTEITFPDRAGDLRPDGVLVLATGRQRWVALVEAKAGRTPIEEEQIERYAAVARHYGMDAVVTVSNQRVSLPDQVPYAVPKAKRVSFRHGSWASIRTEAELILNSEREVDEEQRYILEEMVEYFRHSGSGVLRFDQMNQEWASVVDASRNKSPLEEPTLEATVGAWHQEVRDICLILSRRTNDRVDCVLPLKHRRGTAGGRHRLRDDCELLKRSWRLRCTLRVPNAASDIDVVADLSSRTIECVMELGSPQDKKSASARINWLKRQLQGKVKEPAEVILRAYWHRQGRKSPHTQATLSKVIEGTWHLESASSDALTRFEVVIQRELSGKFRSRKQFVTLLEKLVDDYYAHVGQYLRAWQKQPPQVEDRGGGADTKGASAETA